MCRDISSLVKMENANISLGKRRVVAQGPYSFVVTIPPIWVRNAKVGRYDFVELEMAPDGSLVIKPCREASE